MFSKYTATWASRISKQEIPGVLQKVWVLLKVGVTLKKSIETLSNPNKSFDYNSVARMWKRDKKRVQSNHIVTITFSQILGSKRCYWIGFETNKTSGGFFHVYKSIF